MGRDFERQELVTALEIESEQIPAVASIVYVEERHAPCRGQGCEECYGSGLWRREVRT